MAGPSLPGPNLLHGFAFAMFSTFPAGSKEIEIFADGGLLLFSHLFEMAEEILCKAIQAVQKARKREKKTDRQL